MECDGMIARPLTCKIIGSAYIAQSTRIHALDPGFANAEGWLFDQVGTGQRVSLKPHVPAARAR